jgi:multidrug efflux pump subunit AcrB
MVGFFIQRPIFGSAIAVIMVLAGSICYFLLPVSQFPDITPRKSSLALSIPARARRST